MRGKNISNRPLIALPARFTETASVLRYRGEVVPRSLVEAVYAAGGEPIVIHPNAPVDLLPHVIDSRLGFVDAILLPGGGDVSPTWTQSTSHHAYDGVDLDQDRFDLAVARWAVQQLVPVLAICRGMQVLNVAFGGRIAADMSHLPSSPTPHLNRIHEVVISPDSAAGNLFGDRLQVSCFHHQCIEELASILRPVAYSSEGIIEAVEVIDPHDHPWALGVQWHPEDTVLEDPKQMLLFEDFVDAARRTRSQRGDVSCA